MGWLIGLMIVAFIAWQAAQGAWILAGFMAAATVWILVVA